VPEVIKMVIKISLYPFFNQKCVHKNAQRTLYIGQVSVEKVGRSNVSCANVLLIWDENASVEQIYIKQMSVEQMFVDQTLVEQMSVEQKLIKCQ
jgi:hypothetical protein